MQMLMSLEWPAGLCIKSPLILLVAPWGWPEHTHLTVYVCMGLVAGTDFLLMDVEALYYEVHQHSTHKMLGCVTDCYVNQY